MKLLVTGGNGFLGKHVLKEFHNQQINYLAPKSSELNLLDFNALCDYLNHHQPTTILHMAAICGGIVKNSHIPADFLRENTQFALNIYEEPDNVISLISTHLGVCVCIHYTVQLLLKKKIFGTELRSQLIFHMDKLNEL